MGIKLGFQRLALAVCAGLGAQLLLAGCFCDCDERCFRARVSCEESCDRHYERDYDPVGWEYCVRDCGAAHDSCEYYCDDDQSTY
jgi:hypothetical protein